MEKPGRESRNPAWAALALPRPAHLSGLRAPSPPWRWAGYEAATESSRTYPSRTYPSAPATEHSELVAGLSQAATGRSCRFPGPPGRREAGPQ